MSILLTVIISVSTALTAITAMSLRHVRKMRELDVEEARRADQILQEEADRPYKEECERKRLELEKQSREDDAARNAIVRAELEARCEKITHDL